MITANSLSGQSLTIDDILSSIPQSKDQAIVRKFLDSKGFDYDTVMLPGPAGKLYSFNSTVQRTVKGLSGNVIEIPDIILLRVENDNVIRKLTLMTASKEFYEALTGQMLKYKFKQREQQDKGKPVVYESDQYAGITISLSVVQAVKAGDAYERFQLAVNY